MSDKENWVKLKLIALTNAQYPGVFSDKQKQCVYYTSDYSELSSFSDPDPYLLWNDIQLKMARLTSTHLH